MRPLEPVGAQARWALGLAFFVLFVLAWSVATFGGFVSPTFLASPLTMLKRNVPGYGKINDGSTPYVGDDDIAF